MNMCLWRILTFQDKSFRLQDRKYGMTVRMVKHKMDRGNAEEIYW